MANIPPVLSHLDHKDLDHKLGVVTHAHTYMCVCVCLCVCVLCINKTLLYHVTHQPPSVETGVGEEDWRVQPSRGPVRPTHNGGPLVDLGSPSDMARRQDQARR